MRSFTLDHAQQSCLLTAGKKTRPPSLAEEAALLKYYAGKIQEMCRAFGFPNKVQATAVLFLKRFFLTYSALQHDPKNILLTAIYLAGKVLHLLNSLRKPAKKHNIRVHACTTMKLFKSFVLKHKMHIHACTNVHKELLEAISAMISVQVEEAYIGAEEFCKRLQQDEEVVLNTEPLVLQGLNFDLITYSPYTSLSGYFAVSINCFLYYQHTDEDSGADQCCEWPYHNMRHQKHILLGQLDEMIQKDRGVTGCTGLGCVSEGGRPAGPCSAGAGG